MLSIMLVIANKGDIMQVKKINDWFEKFGRFEVKHRWGFILGLAIITIVCSLGLTRLKLDNGAFNR